LFKLLSSPALGAGRALVLPLMLSRPGQSERRSRQHSRGSVSPPRTRGSSEKDRFLQCLKRIEDAESTLAGARKLLLEIWQEPLSKPTESPPQEPARESEEEDALSDLTVSRCIQVFQQKDVSGSGRLPAKELPDVLKTLGLPSSEAEADTFDLSDLLRKCSEQPSHHGRDLLKLEAKFQQVEHSMQKFCDRRRSETERFSQTKKTCVKKRHMKAYLRKELQEMEACIKLPLVVLLLIVYYLAVYFHWRPETLHGVDNAIRTDITENANFAFNGMNPWTTEPFGHKNIHDVHSIADFWSWFNLGLVPLFWPEGWSTQEVRSNVATHCTTYDQQFLAFGWGASSSWHRAANMSGINMSQASREGQPCVKDDKVLLPQETQRFFGADTSDPNDYGLAKYLMFHSIIGGVRLTQERQPLRECPNVLSSAHLGECVSGTNFLDPELLAALSEDEDLLDHGRTEYLMSRWSQKEVREKLRELEDAVWFSPQTTKVDITYTTYNAHLALITVTRIVFHLNRAGHIEKIIEPSSFWLFPYHDWSCYLLDCMLAVLILKIVVEEGIDVALHWRQMGVIQGTKVYARLANMVDWLSAVLAVVIVAYWCDHLFQLDKVTNLLDGADHQIPGNWANEADREEWFDLCNTICKGSFELRTILGHYTFVIVLRFFKAFSLQPRLSLVTRTLSQASVDVIHFGVVFMSVFVVYTISGMFFFGQELEGFANYGRATASVFSIMQGDWDWDQLIYVGRNQTYFWFYSFNIFVVLLMLNMLLAIIMDTYTEVKGHVGADAETFWSQGREIYERWRAMARKQAVSMQQILLALEPDYLNDDDDADDADDDTWMTVTDLLAKVPELPEGQANDVFSSAQRFQHLREQELREQPMSISDMTGKVGHMELQLNEVYDGLGVLAEATHLSSGTVMALMVAQERERVAKLHDVCQGCV